MKTKFILAFALFLFVTVNCKAQTNANVELRKLYYKAAVEEKVNDVFVMYYIVTILSAMILSVGMILENRRIRKLEELKLVRKELDMLYNDPSAKTIIIPGSYFMEDEQLN